MQAHQVETHEQAVDGRGEGGEPLERGLEVAARLLELGLGLGLGVGVG